MINKINTLQSSKFHEKIYGWKKFNYISDPHTATSLNILSELNNDDINIALACAHPAKFPNSIKDSIDLFPEQPKKLADMMIQTKDI